MIKKIDNVNRPVKKGEVFSVPCIVQDTDVFDTEWVEDFGVMTPIRKKVKQITPVINHPHNDKENGQSYVHYHADFRFIDTSQMKPSLIRKDKHLFMLGSHRPKAGKIEYLPMKVVNEHQPEGTITEVSYIKNSKLKHKCIHKGKCPHRGYDLSKTTEQNGIITCPLHGLKFDAKTKKVLNHG